MKLRYLWIQSYKCIETVVGSRDCEITKYSPLLLQLVNKR